MMEWWSGLTPLNQVFFGVAVFFSVIFLWQFIGTLIGLVGGGSDAELQADTGDAGHFDVETDTDMDAHVEVDHSDFGHVDAEAESSAHVEPHETMVAFKLLSVRSVTAFGMLFGWAGALYLHDKKDLGTTLLLSFVWAMAGMFVVATLFYLMRRMTETGTPALATCVGQPGTVYMNIPPNGTGQVRTMVSGVLSVVNARSTSDQLLTQGEPVTITKILNENTVQVEKTD